MFIYFRGDLALFSQVDTPAHRVSYPVPPFSAVQGMVESILWKQGMNWRPRRVWVLEPVHYIRIMRNERKEPDKYTQRRSVFLNRVAYVFEVEPVVPLRVEGNLDRVVKYKNMLQRAIKTGRTFRPPVLGTRECLAEFGPPPQEWEARAAESNPAGIHLDVMPYEIQYVQRGAMRVPSRTVFARYEYNTTHGFYTATSVLPCEESSLREAA